MRTWVRYSHKVEWAWLPEWQLGAQSLPPPLPSRPAVDCAVDKEETCSETVGCYLAISWLDFNPPTLYCCRSERWQYHSLVTLRCCLAFLLIFVLSFLTFIPFSFRGVHDLGIRRWQEDSAEQQNKLVYASASLYLQMCKGRTSTGFVNVDHFNQKQEGKRLSRGL